MLLTKKSNYLKIDLTLPDKKVFEMLFGLSTIISHKSHSSVLNICQNSCFKIGQFQQCVAYKSVAHKKKTYIDIVSNWSDMKNRVGC